MSRKSNTVKRLNRLTKESEKRSIKYAAGQKDTFVREAKTGTKLGDFYNDRKKPKMLAKGKQTKVVLPK